METLRSVLRLLPSCLLLYGIKAFAQPGTLDPSFGTNGVVTIVDGTGSGIVLQPDGKILVEGFLTSGVLTTGVVRYESGGVLDTTFGTDGVASIAGLGGWGGHSIALQPDGKILAMRQDFSVARFDPGGLLDSTFGVNGVALPVLNPYRYANAMARQSDGRIIVVGSTDTTGGWYMTAVRYDESGALDPTFGSGGQIHGLFGQYSEAESIVLQPDGKILLGVSSSNGVRAARYNLDGTLDQLFGTNGLAILGMWPYATRAMAVQSDGRIVLAGGTDQFGLARLNSDGSLDQSFGSNGVVLTDFTNGTDIARTLAIQSDGKILAAGSEYYGVALARYLPNGDLDGIFGVGGKVNTDLPSMVSDCWDMVVQPDNKILLSGSAWSTQTNTGKFLMLRYLNDLSLGTLELGTDSEPSFIYPNPLFYAATFQYSLTQDETLTLEILDATGRIARTIFGNAKRAPGEHRETLDLSGLAAGNYTLVLRNGEGAVSVKVVKQ